MDLYVQLVMRGAYKNQLLHILIRNFTKLVLNSDLGLNHQEIYIPVKILIMFLDNRM